MFIRKQRGFTSKVRKKSVKQFTGNKMKFSIESLRVWFDEEKRDLPWRREPTPYSVWISEVMLQQTTAQTVGPYFEKWMKRFPTIADLAQASIEDVIKLWEGLGYYSRAYHLHSAAKQLMEQYNGSLPREREALERMKGVGPYTVGAILSFGFHQKAAAVDGNVLRVISRLFEIDEEIDKPKTRRKIEAVVFELLPDTEPWVIMEALIELGAKVCKPKPNCHECPLKDHCLAVRKGVEKQLPKKKRGVKMTDLKRFVFVICYENAYLVQKHEGKKVMSGLYEFPYSEKQREDYLENAIFIKPLAHVKHTFTRFRAHLFPSLWRSREAFFLKNFEWISLNDFDSYPFSSGHRKIYQQLLEDHAHLTH